MRIAGAAAATAASATAGAQQVGEVTGTRMVEVAPADVHLVIAGKEGGPQRPAAEQLAGQEARRGRAGEVLAVGVDMDRVRGVHLELGVVVADGGGKGGQ